VSLSRDEAREIAVVAVILTIVLRLLAGVFQVVDELSRAWTWQSALGRFLAPVGSTMGMLSLALALLLVLSPRGSISMRVRGGAVVLTGFVATLGAISVINGLTGFGPIAARLWFTMLNGASAAVLGAAACWILLNHDDQR